MVVVMMSRRSVFREHPKLKSEKEATIISLYKNLDGKEQFFLS